MMLEGEGVSTLLERLIDAYAIGYVQDSGHLPSWDLMLHVEGYFKSTLGIEQSLLQQHMRTGSYGYAESDAEKTIKKGLPNVWVEHVYQKSIKCFPYGHHLSVKNNAYMFQDWKDLNEWGLYEGGDLVSKYLAGCVDWSVSGDYRPDVLVG